MASQSLSLPVTTLRWRPPAFSISAFALSLADAGIRPTLFIHKRCAHLIECIANLQHDPNRPEDVLKADTDEEGVGGDDAADALRYLVATKRYTSYQTKLVGL